MLVAEVAHNTPYERPVEDTLWTARCLAQVTACPRIASNLADHRAAAVSTDAFSLDKVRNIVGLHLHSPA